MSAVVVCHVDDKGVYHVKPFCWFPGNVRERGNEIGAPLEAWIKEGFLTAAGIATDPRTIAKKVGELSAEYQIAGVAFDRWRVVELKRALDELGVRVPLVEHGQGFKDMSHAVDSLERAIVSKELRHGGHPVLTMCAFNAVVTRDPSNNKKFDKAKSSGPIDAIVACAMALSLPSKAPVVDFDPECLIA
jgi:phage terminase large subunit-like protein